MLTSSQHKDVFSKDLLHYLIALKYSEHILPNQALAHIFLYLARYFKYEAYSE